MEVKKESAIDLVRIENVFISTSDEANLSQLLTVLDAGGRKFLTTKHSRRLVQYHISNLDQLFGLDQYNGVYNSEFDAFGQPIFIGTMYQRFNIADQMPISKNKVKGLIDLVIVNFGNKKFQDLNRDEQAALFVLQAAINNFSRVMVLTDPEDYGSFLEYFERKGTYSTGDNEKRRFAGTTEMNARFQFAKKASEMIAGLFNEFSNSTMEEQRWEVLKRVTAHKV